MTALFLFFVVWAAASIVQSAARKIGRSIKPRHRPRSTPRPVTASRNALCALQEQRREIETALAWCDDLISTEENPEKVLRWMTKRGQLRGQLATVETKITKLVT